MEVPRPLIVAEYNRFMGGVDLNDMLVALYHIDIRSKRYYLRIIFHLIDISIVNAWLLYRRHCNKRDEKYKPLVEFRAEIAQTLIIGSTLDTPSRRGRPSSETNTSNRLHRTFQPRPINVIRYSGWGHFPEYSDRQRCRQCIKGQTKVYCSKCKVHLCFTPLRNCFKEFHDSSK